MLQSRVISEAFFTFVSIREFMVLCQSSVLFKLNGFIRLYFDWVIFQVSYPYFRIWSHDSNHRRSRCATT